ncbi:conserved membrane hypothetical protein [Microbacterium sp. 8M]|jgi:hypothetical protein|uniref:hypothetical protein n=1 Tax=Microbacterium sp. 8M TaxID=2653153 RepID=UPI0012F2F19D|nr:hypothetical protein [Microbacterium sp. 8M]VXB75710.1 conserved membrane hypothetical protein [Microbacterium sp. 8M]
MSEIDTTARVARRTVLKGAAWSVPVVAAAVATPLAAASTNPPCPTCYTSGIVQVLGLPIIGAWTSQAVVLGNTAAILLAPAFGLDTSACSNTGFLSAYTYTFTSAALTMSAGNGVPVKTYTQTLTNLVGAGTLGLVDVLTAIPAFTGVSMPNGGGLGYTPAPTHLQICMDVFLTIDLGAGAPGSSVTCSLCFDWDLHGVGTGIVTLGAGTVNFTGTATPA